MTTINQKEYLKKYLGIGKVPGEKKKKKKKENTVGNRLKIIDDDADVLLSQEIQEDITAADEDAPQIVAVIDERPPSLRIDEQTKSNLWKPVGETDVATSETKTLKLSAGFKLNKQIKSVSSVHSDSKSFYNVQKHKTEYDTKLSKEVNLPLHKSRWDDNSSRNRKEDDYSPPRKTIKRNASLSQEKSGKDDNLALGCKSNELLKKDTYDDKSPPRRKNSAPSRKNDRDDNSPPRRSYKDDNSPLRRKYSEDDNSPSRRGKDNIDSSPLRKRDKRNNSPPRRKNKEKDNSPPKRRNPVDDGSPLHRINREKDISPPRRNKYHDSSPRQRKHRENDCSPLRKRNKYDDSPSWSKHIDDNSPPRRRDKERDISPLRKRNREDISPPRRKNHDDFSPPRKSRGIDDKSETSGKPEKTEEKMRKTLDGKTAGLQSAKDLVKETTLLRQKEDHIFENMSAEVSGKGAATVVRGKKIRDFEEEARQLKKEKETKEKYDRWGKGLKQMEDQNQKFTEQLHEMSKPLARYADDEDLEKYLKEQEREGDPMLMYIRKKRRKEAVAAGISEKPMYKGEFMPNRFGIRPGYRWDGVDRSNGYEKKWFQVQNSRKATQEEAFKWSTEDM